MNSDTSSNSIHNTKLRNNPGRDKETEREYTNKRKSEVLIAAQSLDNEVKNVKNLKRLSIGSMDLLIDPELEFRVNNNTRNPNSRKSWTAESSSTSDNIIKSKEILTRKTSLNIDSRPNQSFDSSLQDEYSGNDDSIDDSIDITQSEYLHDENVLASHESNSNRANYPASSPRNLSGVRTLRRGPSNVRETSRKPTISNRKKALEAASSDLANNLLWVPANQHPNVEPKNYLELVQDTLQNIKLDENGNELTESDSDIESNKENMEERPKHTDRLSADFSKKHSSLVRKPSRLRTSYTEVEEENPQDDDGSFDVNKSGFTDEGISIVEEGSDILDAEDNYKDLNSSKPPKYNRRSVSLKDITEELTKITNKAGLTDGDAITLARTLSISGSFSNELPEEEEEIDRNTDDSSLDQGLSSSFERENNNEDEQFASNMLMKNGISIPQRSSLRRSKFNTYRIRSTSASTTSNSTSLTSSGTIRRNATTIPSINYTPPDDEVTSTSQTKETIHAQDSPSKYSIQTESVGSPGSFSDLYDHYRSSSIDWDKEIKSNTLNIENEEEQDDVTHVSTSRDSSFLSNESSSDSVLYKPATSRSNFKEQLETHNDNSNLKESVQINNKSPPEKRPWSWLKGKSEAKESQEIFLDSDTIKQDRSSDVIIENQSKSNHHRPIFKSLSGRSEHEHDPLPTDKAERESNTDQDIGIIEQGTVTSKKPSFEQKIAKLFKRRHHRRSSSHTSNEIEDKDTALREDIKQKVSKFRKSPKKQLDLGPAIVVDKESSKNLEESTDLASIHHESEPLEDSKLEPRISIDSQERDEIEDSADDLPGLQPAVSVTSLKNSNSSSSVSETVTIKELDEDDSQEYSNTSEVNVQDRSVATEEYETTEDNFTPTAQPLISTLPPRKLTFADVKRPERANAPMQFTDSAFGFPLPVLTVSTVIMFDQRLGINVERAIYRLSHLKLSDSKRELRQQVLLSNFMYAYLNLVNHTLYMEQAASSTDPMDQTEPIDQSISDDNMGETTAYTTEQNESNGTILIPEI